MIRLLFYIAVIFALGLGFAWLADRPGDMVVTFGGYQYRVSLMVAAVLVVALVATIMIAWWLLKSIWNSPHAVARYFRARKRDRGYQALSTGMIAAGAGDAETARRYKKQAMKLISADQEPMIHLLDAQASLLEGDHEAARAKFQAMLDDPEMRLLGLRGLYLEARRLGDHDAARHYAAEAATASPGLGWAATATLEALGAERDWDGAIRLLDAQQSTRNIDREQADRRRAVLLTAKAMDVFDTDPIAARNAAVEAVRLAPGLVPASIVAARAHIRHDDLRKGAKVLEAAWKREPHPEIADAYVHARHGDSTHDRLERAKKLRVLKPHYAVSEMAVARAALEAGEFEIARKAAEASLRLQPGEGACLLMADIEEAETGDQGRIRYWLGRAVRAPRDPAWVADGYVSERWAPVSPVSGRLDAFEWKAPVERQGLLIEQEEGPPPLALPATAAVTASPASAAPVVEPDPPAATAPGAAPPADAVEPAVAPPVEPAMEAPVPAPQPSREAAADAGKQAMAPGGEAVSGEHREEADNAARKAANGSAGAHETEADEKQASDGDTDPAAEDAVPPIPDDPGVEPEPEDPEKRRFRLF